MKRVDTDFTSIYWTYASGFPKAANIGKMVDKRNGVEFPKSTPISDNNSMTGANYTRHASPPRTSNEAKTLDGSYGGFQPKPAVEIIIVAMKPLIEKTFVDQALKNGKGITWLTPDCAIPGEQRINQPMGAPNNAYGGYNFTGTASAITTTSRFPANLLVQDNILDDYSRYFLEAWASTLPFLITPKPSKAEKNEGLSHLPVKQSTGGGGPSSAHGSIKARGQNFHPTVKPLKLMCYLITLGSRQGDTVLEPFMGSGTTCLAAKHLNRNYIGIEREKEYVDIATARLNNPAPVQATLIASK